MYRYGDGAETTTTHANYPKRKNTTLTVQSSDAVLFHLHSKDIYASTGAFPKLDTHSGSESIHLDEPSNILELVLQFAERKGQPLLPENLDFDTLAAVAEAVEKYQVFSAMDLCRIRLRNTLPNHSLRILGHALKHDYKKLADEAAFCALSRASLPVAVEHLPPAMVISWIQYCHSWKKLFETRTQAVASKSNSSLHCVPASGDTCPYCACLMIAWFELLQKLDKTTFEFALTDLSNESTPSDQLVTYIYTDGHETSAFFRSLASNLSAGGCKCPPQRCRSMVAEAKILLKDVKEFPRFTSFVHNHGHDIKPKK